MINILKKGRVIGICGDAHTCKSNLLYFFIDSIQEHNQQILIYSYGLRNYIKGVKEIYSIQELEKIKNSIVIIDEFASILDLEDRKKRKQIETTLRLIFHNNNYILLSGLPENYKKFISARLDIMIFTATNLDDLINGSAIKKTLINYNGYERGYSYLALNKGQCLIFDGHHYSKKDIPYLEKYDSKKKNIDLFNQQKSTRKRSIKSAKNVQNKINEVKQNEC